MIYRVKRWHHRCWPIKMGISFKQEFHWTVRFNKTMVYDIGSDQSDVNKVVGRFFPFGGMVKINGKWCWKYEPRFGVRWYQGNLEMMAYVHDDQVVTRNAKICSVLFEKDIDLTMIIDKSEYYLEAGDKGVHIPKTHNLKLSCPTNFFMGGNMAATHDTTVEIK